MRKIVIYPVVHRVGLYGNHTVLTVGLKALALQLA